MPDPAIVRGYYTQKFLDKRRNPPEYVDEELPTKTVHIFSRNKLGTILDPSSGVTIMGSISFSGSHYDFSPGSFALRITRRNVSIGSATYPKLNFEWKLRHSRLGTVDAIPFYKGTVGASARSEVVASPMAPIYSFGPGTLWAYFHPRRGTARVYSSMEGVF